MEKNLKLQHLGLYIFFYKNILDFKINFDMEKFSMALALKMFKYWQMGIVLHMFLDLFRNFKPKTIKIF